jgi:endonuclease/exonuclease/phosphatase family metal-dependent hydrolase
MASIVAVFGVGSRRWLFALINGFVLVASLALIYLNIGRAWSLAWITYTVAAITLWAALGFILSGIASKAGSKAGSWRITLANFLALLVMLVILFMVMQFKMDWISIVAGTILALTSVWAVGFGRQDARFTNPFPSKLVSIPAALGLLIVLLWTILVQPVSAVSVGSPGTALRVMTYNIHQGINADLMVDLESIADAIASENPDVVALNEVNRARATNGFLDVLPYLSRRLGMPYIFGANYQDGQYGNAILSRYPIIEWENTHYINNTTEIRGALRAVIQTPAGEVIFFSTHLDHISGENDARLEQVTELLALWGGAERTVILGDLNAVPDTPEISALYAAGFVDVLLAARQGDVFTFWDPIPTPGRRIDYIFLSPDMLIGNVWVPRTRASDHLPVVAEIFP